MTKKPGFPGPSTVNTWINCVNYALDMMNEFEWMHGTANGGMDGWNGWMEGERERERERVCGAKTVQLSPICATKIARIGPGFIYKFCSKEFSYEAVWQ